MQLPLAIKWNEAADFQRFVAGEHAEAVRWVRDCAEGRAAHLPGLFLHGGRGSGKSHLLQAACRRASELGRPAAYLPLAQLLEYGYYVLRGHEQVGLVAVDELDVLEGREDWQIALFHLFNRASDRQVPLLFAARKPPSQLTLKLADLRSRLSWGGVVALQPPTESTCLEIVRQRAINRGLDLPEATLRYLIRRVPRDLPRLLTLFDELDRASLAAGRRLTVPFVRQIVDRDPHPDSHPDGEPPPRG
ncbi:DnaA regulatory inactivator Hda [Halorhodospira abdelmalekii]|uniref:DnaA regulatory inactivator Hda n=1 Tax=Halorhodospira abdelmalekii TaxID=421629 RepID=UPI001908B6B0|nr:DnaA regulatory inactivator Hda [Halorhodospira abdelmalekii]